MGALIWLVVAIVLAGIEIFAGELTFLMLAGGALAAAGVGLADVPVWVEVVVFTAASIGLLFFLKPVLRRRLQTQPLQAHDTKALVGSSVSVVEQVSAAGGIVRLDGTFWSARPLDPSEVFEDGTMVQVVQIDGSTAVVVKA